MIKHYFTVAFRNLRKYRNQTFISVVGLATGFTCFAMAALWIRYEMTYDNFHRDAGRIYCISHPDRFSPSKMSRGTPNPLAGYLKTTFPEVEDAMALTPAWLGEKIRIEDAEYPVEIMSVDSSFFRMFGVQIIEGSRDFLTPGSEKAAITQQKARQLFGDESPIGKEFDNYGKYTVCAIVSDLPKRSNYRFDFLKAFYPAGQRKWNFSMGENTLLKLAPGVDVDAFGKKLYEHVIKQDGTEIKELTLVPITRLRYVDADIDRDVKFQHILIFALAGFLLIICTLFNYLTLFVSRFRIRQKELTLRRVCGASNRSLFTLLSVEFSLSLLIALALGMVFIEMLHEPFQQLADIQMNLSAVYGESLAYVGAVILVSLLFFYLLLTLLQRRTMQASFRRDRKALFRKGSILMQLFISIGFAFCTVVILKQMYYLHHTDLGFSFKDRGSVGLWDVDEDVLAAQLRQIPEITEAFPAVVSLIPQSARLGDKIESWDEKPEGAEPVNIEFMYASGQYISYYEFRFVEGETLTDSDAYNQVLINESAKKAFGWDTAVGKKLKNYTVKGVIKNTYQFAPTVMPEPFYYAQKGKADIPYNMSANMVLFRYRTGTWKSCKDKIKQLLQKEYPDKKEITLLRTEDEYDKYLKSENALLKILSFVSAVCVLICVFGFVSMISLTCEERRREMAIRKINGATVGNLLSIFFRENFLLLCIGSAIAFAAGHYVMRLWLESYILQTDIPAWIYLSILCVMALVIVLCVGWRVYKASIENPAEVVKSG